jgi:hypothetical protein
VTRPERLLRGTFLLLLLAMGGAVLWQDFGGALPRGLFNEGAGALRSAGAAMLVAIALGAALLARDLVRSRASALGGAVCGVIVAAVMLEGLLTLVDVAVVSRGLAAPLGGPYRELPSAARGTVWVKKPHAGSALGMRTDTVLARESEEPRILFLGDSYTEGSGAGPACNYPEVAAEVVAGELGRPVEVFNAGVAGYGPVDAARLLSHLDADGWRFDAIVYGVFLENDFTDDLPRTERRVVAGINYRFPASPFLRRFHPLNWRTARYGLFLARSASLAAAAPAAVFRPEGSCELAPGPHGPPGAVLSELVLRREAANHGPEARADSDVFLAAVTEMQAIAGRRGVPFALVVFPDRLRVDPVLAGQLGLDPRRPGTDPDRQLRVVRAVAAPRIEVEEALREGAENYREGDTHLSDLGNLRAGRFVGERLAELLAGEEAFGPR